MTRSDLIAIVAGAILLAWFLRTGGVQQDHYVALLVAVAFAAFGWLVKGVNPAGARAGAIVAFIFYAAGGWRLFSLLLAVFVITWLATRAGRAKKQRLGVSEPAGGRNATQVLANLFVSTAVLVFFFSAPHRSLFWFPAAIAALAQVAADTVASEIGEAFGGTPRLIHNLRKAEVGANGGVTIIGSLAGAAAAALIAGLFSYLFSASTLPLAAWQITVAATAGMLFDSFLGATLESRGLLNNDAVNLLSTVFAALACYLLLLSF